MTLDSGPNTPGSAVLLADLASPGKQIDEDMLGSAIFERLLLQDPIDHVHLQSPSDKPDMHTVQADCIIYLFECYRRCKIEKMDSELREKMNSCIIQNSALTLSQPELLMGQEPHLQVLNIVCICKFDDIEQLVVSKKPFYM